MSASLKNPPHLMLAYLLTLIVAGSSVPAIVHAAACDAIIGKWAWFAGGEVTMKSDGTFTQQSGNSGTWECTDASKGLVTLKWKQGGYVNRMGLSDNGARLSSTDPSQQLVTATRINPEAPLSDLLQGKKAVNPVPRTVEKPDRAPEAPLSDLLQGRKAMNPMPRTVEKPNRSLLPQPKPMVSADPKTEAVFQQGYDLFMKKQYEQSMPFLFEAAKGGHPRAQALLGRTYQEGLRVPVNHKEAALWYGQAAAQGHRASQFVMGNLYFEGEGVPKDQTKAIALYQQSADQGYDQAEFILGLAYEFGWGGLPRNRQMAIRWLDKAGRHRNGQAGWIATWLEKPDTPHFKDEVQLGRYIGAKIDRWVVSITPGATVSPSGADKCDWRCAQKAEALEKAGRGDSAVRCRGGELEHCN